MTHSQESCGRSNGLSLGHWELGIPWALGSGNWDFVILDELLHRLAACIHEVLRPAGQVGKRDLAHVDPQVVIQRREDVAELARALGPFAAEPIGGADNLAGPHAAASEKAAGNPRPMIAAAILVDRWCATELAPHHHGTIFVAPP